MRLLCLPIRNPQSAIRNWKPPTEYWSIGTMGRWSNLATHSLSAAYSAPNQDHNMWCTAPRNTTKSRLIKVNQGQSRLFFMRLLCLPIRNPQSAIRNWKPPTEYWSIGAMGRWSNLATHSLSAAFSAPNQDHNMWCTTPRNTTKSRLIKVNQG